MLGLAENATGVTRVERAPLRQALVNADTLKVSFPICLFYAQTHKLAVPSRRGPPKGYRKGAADPSSLVPKIAKIREHIQSLQVAYGEHEVLRQLHLAVFGNAPCDPSITEPPPSAGHGAYTGHGHASIASSSSTTMGPPSTASTLASPISASHPGPGPGPMGMAPHAAPMRKSGEWSQDEHNSEGKVLHRPSNREYRDPCFQITLNRR